METVQEQVAGLPRKAGVYLMRDRMGRLLYVGKATDLRSRVRSYLDADASGRGPRISVLMSLVDRVDYIVCGSPEQALLLEQRLIRRYQPKFNVLWRDDKRYPMLAMTREDFPRLVVVRRPLKGARMFGPFPDAGALRRTLRFICRNFPIRQCKLDIAEGVVTKKAERTVRACLYYHIGRCPAPCIAKITKADYAPIVRNVEDFLRGRKKEVIRRLEKEMRDAAERMEYERAARIRDDLEAIRATAQAIRLREVKEDELLEKAAPGAILDALARTLGMEKPPRRIEAFDISNLGGRGACGSMVVLENGEPRRADYRMFRIRTVEGQDDFACMREVVSRRYAGSLAGGGPQGGKGGKRRGKGVLPDPDLILIDGGKGQLNAAREALAAAGKNIPAIGLAKREEEIYLPDSPEPLLLPRDSPALHLLQRVRDEAHRFALRYQRILRKKEMGIGGRSE